MNRNHLQQLITSFKSALDSYTLAFKPNNDPKKEIKASSVPNPIDEVKKLTALIKAHTTKVGIIFKGELLNQDSQAAFNTLQQLSETVGLEVSVMAQLCPEDVSRIFYDEIMTRFMAILHAHIGFVDQLQHIEQGHKPAETEGRLVSVGKVWSSCDDLTNLINQGRLGLLSYKFNQSIGVINDGLDDFEEWSKDPYISEDPFGSDDDDDDESHELSPQQRDHIKTIGDQWVTRIKLIKLLLTSVSKLLPKIPSGKTVDIIYDNQKRIVVLIDRLIMDIMMNGEEDEETKKYGVEIGTKMEEILKEIKSGGDEKKVKWCEAWEKKWEEIEK